MGQAFVSTVDGDLRIDVAAANVTVDDAKGSLLVDTGSGEVTASSVRANDVKIDTGSGNVRLDLLADVRALDVDTGSGGVTINVPADLRAEVDIETGSGDIDLQNVTVRTTRLERDHLTGEIGDGKGRIRIETGSGGVRLVRTK